MCRSIIATAWLARAPYSRGVLELVLVSQARAAPPPRVQHRTAVGARWHLPRGVRRFRILHRPQNQVQQILLGPFVRNTGCEVGMTGVSALFVGDDEVPQSGCMRLVDIKLRFALILRAERRVDEL